MRDHLEPDTVQVWLVRLDQPEGAVHASAGLLSEEETQRAQRFHFERDRRRFTVARSCLRRLLGFYTGLDPADVVLVAGPYGRPLLEPERGFQFNVSHSHERAAIAFSMGKIGVDIEHMRPLPDLLGMARHAFSPAEIASLLDLQEAGRQRAFFTLWTRKEAYLKAIGLGFSGGSQSFTVSLAADDLRFLELADPFGSAQEWSLANLTVEPEYVGAVAMEGSAKPVLTRWVSGDLLNTCC